jgi:hypothetical protein
MIAAGYMGHLSAATHRNLVLTAQLNPRCCELKLSSQLHLNCNCLQGAMGLATYRIRVLPAPPNQGPHFDAAAEPAAGINTGLLQGTLTDNPHKHSDIFEIGQFSSAVECARKLRQRGLVHAMQGDEGADAVLLLRLELADVL